MAETLLSASNVLLFGRVVEDLSVGAGSHSPSDADTIGGNALLESQLAMTKTTGSGSARKTVQMAKFARIYGFGFEGTYFEMPTPSLFLVHGDGEPATKTTGSGASAKLSNAGMSITGLATRDVKFSDDMRVWSYDQSDFTIRLDVQSGTFEEVLVALGLGGMSVAGAKLSGAKVAGAKVSGAKVSGAKVSGAKVSGAKVSGAKLSGDASD